MFKRLDHAGLALIIVLLGIGILFSVGVGISHSLFFSSWAKTPVSVGDKAAPVSTLEVKQVAFTGKKAISLSQAKQSIGSSIGSRTATPLYELTEYQMTWMVTVEDGTLAPVSAQVFIPTGTSDQLFPLIVYGTGSTGLADRCAPSRENLARGNMGNYRNYMISQASQGYIVIMPNYEGFDNARRNPHYFNRDSEARTLLSAAKALLTSTNQLHVPYLPDALFFGGYSQGGHAAFSAADYAQTFTPELKVAGVYGHGPTTDIFELLKSNPNLAGYLVASYSEYYPAIDPHKILEPRWITYMDRARRICVDEGFGVHSTTIEATFADPFETALKTNTISTTFPEIHAVFVENSSGTSYVKIPTMIVHGTADPIVSNQAQDAFVKQLCDRGISVDLKEYSGVHHFDTREVSFKDTNAWITAVSRGEPVRNSCLER